MPKEPVDLSPDPPQNPPRRGLKRGRPRNINPDALDYDGFRALIRPHIIFFAQFGKIKIPSKEDGRSGIWRKLTPTEIAKVLVVGKEVFGKAGAKGGGVGVAPKSDSTTAADSKDSMAAVLDDEDGLPSLSAVARGPGDV